MTKILFLDFDGVLLPDSLAHKQVEKNGLNPDNYLEIVEFDQHCVANLNKIIAATHAEIVLSTSWAMGNSISKLSNCLLRNGIDPSNIFEYDDPIHGSWLTPRKMSSLRSNEIGWWIGNHPEITNWVAIDDDPSILHLKTNYVRTNPAVGLNAEAASKAITILNKIEKK
jgi:hypothetical protein